MEHFSFTYADSETPSLSDVTLKIRKGEFVLLTGKSGCGKTTLTRCVNGLIPDFFEGKLFGNCFVWGMDIKKHEAGDYSPFVGSVFQDPRSQFFTLHVKTEISFSCENLGTPREQIQKGCQEAVNVLEIKHLLNKSIFHLSSGEKQKVAVASTYAAGVHVFVLDEPSANLDEVGTKQIFEVLKKLKEQGHTIIISEHKIYYLKELVDRVILMQDGKIKEDITGKEFAIRPSNWFFENGLRQNDLEVIMPTLPFTSSPQNDSQIRVEDISFYYDKKIPLWKNVSFEAGSGDIVGVIGKNGVGKSTLFRVLMGLEKSKSGKIYMNQKYAAKGQRKKNSFYVMQDVDYQLFAPSVLEEMLLGTSETEEEKKKAMHLLEYFGLAPYVHAHPSELSGGQKQRLSIALAYMGNADFLYLDEPTSGLDGENMLLVSRAICNLAKKGCCIFVITHDYEFAAQTFRSLLIFKQREKVIRIPPEQYDPKRLYQNFKLEKENKNEYKKQKQSGFERFDTDWCI
jgi:energy-coupling factor transport system ATP-binding protein